MKQILILILTLTLIFPTYAFSQEAPKVTDIQKGQSAPFSGTLLNPSAAAQIIAEKENLKSECNLKYEYIKARERAKCDLLMGNLNVSLDITQKKYDSILQIKDAEIQRLQKIAVEDSGDYSHWWFAGGILSGILISIGVFYASIEIAKQ